MVCRGTSRLSNLFFICCLGGLVPFDSTHYNQEALIYLKGHFKSIKGCVNRGTKVQSTECNLF